MKPKRLQRSRSKGYKMPKRAIYVGRPSKWGNPFKLIGDMIYCDALDTWHNNYNPWVLYDKRIYSKKEGIKRVIELCDDWIHQRLQITHYTYMCVAKRCPFTIEDIKRELKGKDLVCWCPKNQDCHSRILIEIANN